LFIILTEFIFLFLFVFYTFGDIDFGNFRCQLMNLLLVRAKMAIYNRRGTS